MAKGVIYSKCGFYCNRCPAYKDNSTTEADRQRGSALWEKYFGLHFNPEIVRCEGCQAQEPWKTGNILPDRRCHIRACAIFNGFPTCAQCSLFPCEEYKLKVPGAGLKQQRESAGNMKISDEEYKEYLEQFEGQTHLKQLRDTLQPKDIREPKQLTVEENIAPFPEKMILSESQQKDMGQLHTLLRSVFSQQASTYAGQVLLDRKKPYLWGIMWVMGRHGVIKDGKLVLESGVCGDIKECSRLVRKSTNTLHDAVQDAVDTLNKCGLHIEFKAFKKNWIMTLDVDQKLGGPVITGALKTYITNLVSQYGDPAYINSYNLKGKAFKLFARVDMCTL